MTGLPGSGRLDLEDVNHRLLATAERLGKEPRLDVEPHALDGWPQVIAPFPLLAPRLALFLDLVDFTVLLANEPTKGFLEVFLCHTFERGTQAVRCPSLED